MATSQELHQSSMTKIHMNNTHLKYHQISQGPMSQQTVSMKITRAKRYRYHDAMLINYITHLLHYGQSYLLYVMLTIVMSTLTVFVTTRNYVYNSGVSCQKGPIRHQNTNTPIQVPQDVFLCNISMSNIGTIFDWNNQVWNMFEIYGFGNRKDT